jgi:hypothetical protein
MMLLFWNIFHQVCLQRYVLVHLQSMAYVKKLAVPYTSECRIMLKITFRYISCEDVNWIEGGLLYCAWPTSFGISHIKIICLLHSDVEIFIDALFYEFCFMAPELVNASFLSSAFISITLPRLAIQCFLWDPIVQMLALLPCLHFDLEDILNCINSYLEWGRAATAVEISYCAYLRSRFYTFQRLSHSLIL